MTNHALLLLVLVTGTLAHRKTPILVNEDQHILQTCLYKPTGRYFSMFCSELHHPELTNVTKGTAHLSKIFTTQASYLWQALIAYYTECWPIWSDPLACPSAVLEFFESKLIGYAPRRNITRQRMHQWIDGIDDEGELVKHCFLYHKQVAIATPTKRIKECRGISFQWNHLKKRNQSPARTAFIRQKWANMTVTWNSLIAKLSSSEKTEDVELAILLQCEFNTHWRKKWTRSDPELARKLVLERDPCTILNHPELLNQTEGGYDAGDYQQILNLTRVYAKRTQLNLLRDCLKYHSYQPVESCRGITWTKDKEGRLIYQQMESWNSILKELDHDEAQRAAKIAALNKQLFPVIDFVLRLREHCANFEQLVRSDWIQYDCTTLGHDFPPFKILQEYTDYIKYHGKRY